MRIPDWTETELILALDLYLRLDPPSTHPAITELSLILRKLPYDYGLPVQMSLRDADPDQDWIAPPPEMPGEDRKEFRSPDAVYFKIHDFRCLDPRNDLWKDRDISRETQRVWEEWSDKADRVQRIAEMIREQSHYQSKEDSFLPSFVPSGGGLFFPEGEDVWQRHRKHETDPFQLLQVKKDFIARHGRLTCEACNFDFIEQYGEMGRGFIEIHHDVPPAELEDQQARNEDLRLVCSNCHNLLHRRRRWLTVSELKHMRDMR